MKHIYFFLVLLLSASFVQGQPQYFRIKPLEGYFLDPKVRLKEGPNFFVIRDRRKFIKYFGLVNKPDTPNLEFNHVIVMALPPTKKQATIGFMPKAAKAGNYIEVYCVIDEDKFPLTYTAYPVVLAQIPKYFSVTKVNFYNEKTKELIASVPIR